MDFILWKREKNICRYLLSGIWKNLETIYGKHAFVVVFLLKLWQNGHHIQFNIVDSETLRQAQQKPDEYRDLLVRVAGYSDYFVDLDEDHQEEIIARTQHDSI